MELYHFWIYCVYHFSGTWSSGFLFYRGLHTIKCLPFFLIKGRHSLWYAFILPDKIKSYLHVPVIYLNYDRYGADPL
ncbi:hypothetical protein BBV17_06500 [Cytobacillus oceanisediminis]|uniref:Uncharacterized protein n=1 Tax=Cytobacillus oceanisediminis TaxID=665099 RepID=A0ABX3D051_9BACI|nr:hypothetical protein BBV17_06500 [Cytobacillus oceanisediminis]